MGEGGGGISGWADLILPGWLTRLQDYANVLINFAQNPLRFLRARVIPVVLGGIFGNAFNIADTIALGFNSVNSSLQLAGQAMGNALGQAASAILYPLAVFRDAVIAATTPFGALQPFVVTAVWLVSVYVMVIATIRLLRAIADSVPVVSGIETFFFG